MTHATTPLPSKGPLLLKEGLFRDLLHIHLPWTDPVLKAGEAMLEAAALSGEGGILVIVGPPGSGKSHLTRQCLAHLRQIWMPGEFERFDVEIDAESCGTRKDFAAAVVMGLHEATTSNALANGTGKDFSRFLLANARSMGLRVVASHEAHNLQLHGRLHTGVELAAHIKNMTNKGVSYIFNGLPALEKNIGSHEELMSRLGANVFRIPTFNPKKAGDLKTLKKLFGEIEEALPVSFTPGLSSKNVLLSMALAGEGVLRPMTKLLQYTVNDALKRNSAVVTPADFQRASAILFGDAKAEKLFTGDTATVKSLYAGFIKHGA
jgi:hypothetical protein